MDVQDGLAIASVVGAVAFLVNKLVLAPAARAKTPDVTTRSLVRRARKKKHAPSCHD